MLRRLLAALIVLAALGASGVALADPPRVSVQVRPASVDGTVTVTSGGRAFTCHTHAGACTLTGVPGGPAQATFAPDGGGAATPPRSVMIAPSGDTQLVLSAGR